MYGVFVCSLSHYCWLLKLGGLAKENLFFYNKGECIAILLSLAACVFHNLTDAASCGFAIVLSDSHFAMETKLQRLQGHS